LGVNGCDAGIGRRFDRGQRPAGVPGLDRHRSTEGGGIELRLLPTEDVQSEDAEKDPERRHADRDLREHVSGLRAERTLSTGATKGPPKAKPATNKAATITDRLCIQPVPDTKVHRERICYTRTGKGLSTAILEQNKQSFYSANRVVLND
jgi:hypothetical protein